MNEKAPCSVAAARRFIDRFPEEQPSTFATSVNTAYPKSDDKLEDEDLDWVFDRHDLRYGQPVLPRGSDFKAHLLNLGEVDLDSTRVRETHEYAKA